MKIHRELYSYDVIKVYIYILTSHKYKKMWVREQAREVVSIADSHMLTL